MTEACTLILSGLTPTDFPDKMIPKLSTFIANFAMPDSIRDSPQILTKISVHEYTKSIKNGRRVHLHLHQSYTFNKATLGLGSVTSGLCKFLNVVLRCGLVPFRWCNAVSVVLDVLILIDFLLSTYLKRTTIYFLNCFGPSGCYARENTTACFERLRKDHVGAAWPMMPSFWNVWLMILLA